MSIPVELRSIADKLNDLKAFLGKGSESRQWSHIFSDIANLLHYIASKMELTEKETPQA
jgi:hypothetical protein